MLKTQHFKEVFLTDKYTKDVQLNYQYWLINDKPIDMYEMMSILIIYARITLDDRFIYLFKLFATKYSLKECEDEQILPHELIFFIEKFTSALS